MNSIQHGQKTGIRPPRTLVPTSRKLSQLENGAKSQIPIHRESRSGFTSPQTTPTKTNYDSNIFRTPTHQVKKEDLIVPLSPAAEEVHKRLQAIEGEQELRLKKLIKEADEREQEYASLKNKIMSLKTNKADVEFENFKLEDQIHKINNNIQIKQHEIDELLQQETYSLKELERSYELQVKQMKVDHNEKVYILKKETTEKIESLINAKVTQYQNQKTEYQDRIEKLKKEVKESQTDLNRKLIKIKEDHHKKLLKLEDLTESNIELLKKETEHFKNEIMFKSKDIQQTKVRIEEAAKTNFTLSDSYKDIISESKEFEAKINEMRAVINDLTDTLDDKKLQHENLQSEIILTEQDTEYMNKQLIKEETMRRRLHNQLQELKGNIRVFCRVRPPLGDEVKNTVQIDFPEDDFNEDSNQEISLLDPNFTEKDFGSNNAPKNFNFKFDKVFGMESSNSDIFEELSQLVQSALDGYNVCVFAYGQTGSGKTFTMSSADGMIPKTVNQIFETSENLSSKGWSYKFFGQFLEIYNETINDLLGNPLNIDKVKHEIKHDPNTLKTTITDLTSVELTDPQNVDMILNKADNNRTVAATKANERSSRSHSVFIITLHGVNNKTGERCEGVLNLIDLAGSERLSHSQVTGDRLKETQAINKSLSCLGDVIYALGNNQNKENKHVPFRNSKLTFLLQYSLGGNSKTLMFVNISPFKSHFNESINSLRFATKVNNTKIGVPKKVKI